jgi:hypothetical protein
MAKNSPYKTPSEILDNNPDLEKRGWTPIAMGYLFNLGLVKGIRKRKSRRCYLNEEDILRLASLAT